MEDKIKLAILSIVVIASPMPAAMFLVFNDVYVGELLSDTGGVRIDAINGWFEIYSNTTRLIPFQLDLIEITFLLSSAAIFFVCLILVVKILSKGNYKKIDR